jgi:hypothetical protein
MPLDSKRTQKKNYAEDSKLGNGYSGSDIYINDSDKKNEPWINYKNCFSFNKI